jgi:hypothetical protein
MRKILLALFLAACVGLGFQLAGCVPPAAVVDTKNAEQWLDARPDPVKADGRTVLLDRAKFDDSVGTKATNDAVACRQLAKEILIDKIQNILWWVKWFAIPLGVVAFFLIYFLAKMPSIAVVVGSIVAALGPLAFALSFVIDHLILSTVFVTALVAAAVVIEWNIRDGKDLKKAGVILESSIAPPAPKV